MTIRFETKTDPSGKGHPIHAAVIKKAHVDINGRPFVATESVRAKKEPNGWRIDFTYSIGGARMPWEAIDSIEYPTLAAAKAAIRAYAERPASADYRPRRRASRRGRSSRRSSRHGNYASQQPITRPGSRAGLVDVIEVDSRGSVLRVLHRNLTFPQARALILRATG